MDSQRIGSPARGADDVVSALQAAGVRDLFTLSGNQIMPIFDASIGAEIRLIHVRHEAAAVHMADAWGRLTGRPGVALVTAGPGMANCLSALYVAQLAESPLVLLSGHAPLGQRGRGPFQELRQDDLARPVVKASWTVDGSLPLAVEIGRALMIAAHGRPGPVHVSLPADLLEGPASPATAPPDELAEMSLSPAQAAELMASARRAAQPMILAGPSMMRGGAARALRELEGLTSIPVISMESPRGVNDPSLGALADVLRQADWLLLLGKKLDFTLRINNEPAYHAVSQIFQVDAEPPVLELSQRVVCDQGAELRTFHADPRASCTQLIESARQFAAKPNSWLLEVQEAISYRPPHWNGQGESVTGRLHPVQVCLAAQQYLDGGDDSVFISDGGEFGQWAQACVRAPHRLINGTAGSIGSAIPFALAARVAHPEARIVTALGDGTCGFHPMEFDTAVRCQLPFIAMLGNDALWNAEYQIQLRRYGVERAVGCELRPTRYDQLVRTMGGYGEHVTSAEGLPAAFDRAHRSRLPSCLNADIEGVAAPVIRRA